MQDPNVTFKPQLNPAAIQGHGGPSFACVVLGLDFARVGQGQSYSVGIFGLGPIVRFRVLGIGAFRQRFGCLEFEFYHFGVRVFLGFDFKPHGRFFLHKTPFTLLPNGSRDS